MVKLSAAQISRAFEIGNRMDVLEAKYFFDALNGDFNAKGNLALNAQFDKGITPRVEAIFFLRDLDRETVTA